MNILKDHNFKCNFSTLNVFTFLFKIKQKQKQKNPNLNYVQIPMRCTTRCFLTHCPPCSRATTTSRSGSCLSFPVLRTSLAGNLPSTRCSYCPPWSLTPSTGHRTRRLHGQVCLPKRLDIFKSRSLDHFPYFQWKNMNDFTQILVKTASGKPMPTAI